MQAADSLVANVMQKELEGRWILLVIRLVLFLLGSVGHAVASRHHYL
ncbi:DUF6131 family protein [Streptomyces sp. NPDC002523]